MGDRHDEFKQLKSGLADINTQRGGGPDGVKGFYAEHINAAYSNLERIDKGIAARERVIDDNGDWDAIVNYSKGNTGRPIQDKVGYTYSYYKNKLSSGQYDGGTLRINPDNPVFSDEKKLKDLKEIAKQHGIKIEEGKVTEKELKTLAKAAGVEGKLRSKAGLDQTAPVTASLYVTSKEMEYAVKNAKEKVAEVNSYIYDTTSKFLSENAAQINAVGIQQAESAAGFAAVFSITRNTMAVLKGEENFGQATKEVVTDVASAAVMGYATGAISNALGVAGGDASLLINGTIQITKQMTAYLNGSINEEVLVKNVAELGVQLSAAYIGRAVGKSIGAMAGPIGILVGQYVGEMISTAVCADVMSTIKASKEFEKQNQKAISLYRNAEREIRASQERLEELIQKENNELLEAIAKGMDSIAHGIMNGSYNEVESGLACIGQKFGVNLEMLQENRVTYENLFDDSSDTIVFD